MDLVKISPEKYKKMKKCKFCQIYFDLSDLKYKITKRMLIQAENHLLVKIYKIKSKYLIKE